MNILIKNAVIVTVDEANTIINGGEIAVAGNRIAHVGPAGSTPPDFVAERVIDATGKAVLPGFVNCHTHAAMTLFRSYADDMPLMPWLQEKIWPVEARLEKEDVYWGTLLACIEMIRSGTTTFADMYFFMQRAAAAVAESGMRASLCRGMIGVAPNAEEVLVRSRILVEKWHGAANGRITVMLGPHAPYTCPPPYLRRVVDLAKQLGIGIHIHLAETLTEVEQIKKEHGMTPIELVESVGLFEVPVLAAHCVHLTDHDISLLAAAGAGVAHNPQSNMKLASGIAPVEKLRAAGVVVGIGTDGAASNNNLDMIEEMRTASLLQKVANMDPTALPAPAALAMVTREGARALGLKEVGIIKAGYLADIILIDLKRPHLWPAHDVVANIVYAATAADVATVIIDGQIVMEERRLLTMDEEAVMRECEQRARRLVNG